MEKYTSNIDIKKYPLGGYYFKLYIEDTPIFCSARSHPVFLGEYGLYESPEEALNASREMIIRNQSILKEAQDVGPNDEYITSMLVQKYMSMYNFLTSLYKEIDIDKKDKKYNKNHRNVPILDQMLEDYSGDDEQIDLVIKEIEMNTQDDFDIDKPLDEDNLENKYSEKLIYIRDAMRELHEYLKDNFSSFLDQQVTVAPPVPEGGDMGGGGGGMDMGMGMASGSRTMIKTASCESPSEELAGEFLADYARSACSAIGIKSPCLEDICIINDSLCLILRSGDFRFGVLINDDLTFGGVMPMSGITYMSHDFYTTYLRPAFSKIGNYSPVGSDFVMFNTTPDNSLDLMKYGIKECFCGYDKNKGNVRIGVVHTGGQSTKDKCVKFVKIPEIIKTASSFEDQMRTVLNKNSQEIASSSLVKVVKPGSEYEGMAGTVDPKKITIRNDHIEFPVMLEFDNGLKTEVWVTDDDVEVFLK